MNKFEIRTNKKKEAILQAALDLFRRNGFVNTNIKNIAALANVSQVSIYNYFGSKNLLVKEAISSIMDDMIKTADEILSQPLSFHEKVKKAFSLCSEDIGNLIEEFFSVAALEDPQMMQAIVDTLKDKKNQLYRKYIEFGKADACIDTSIPTETILNFLNAIDYASNTTVNPDHNANNREDMLKLVLYGLLIHKELSQ